MKNVSKSFRPVSRSARRRTLPDASQDSRYSRNSSPPAVVSNEATSSQTSSGLQGISVSQLPSSSTLNEATQREQLATIVRKHGKLIDVSFEPLPTSTTPTNGSGTQEVAGNKALLLLQRYFPLVSYFTKCDLFIFNSQIRLFHTNLSIFTGKIISYRVFPDFLLEIA